MPATVLVAMLVAALSAISLRPAYGLPTGPFFMGLGPLTAIAQGVSEDGSTVVGRTPNVPAFRWTEETGAVWVYPLSPSTYWGITGASAVSGDGSTVVGGSRTAQNRDEAFIWTEATGTLGLGIPEGASNSQAIDISADGSIVLVSASSSFNSFLGSYLWTQAAGLQPIPVPGVRVRGISSDGTWIVGSGPVISNCGCCCYNEAFLWSADGGSVGLGDLPGGEFASEAFDVSADGSVVVGNGTLGIGTYQAFRWTEQTGMVPIFGVNSSASAVSGDGSTVVGTQDVLPYGAAVVWDETNGTRVLKDVLVQAGLDLSDWELWRALDVSADGTTIVGTGSRRGIQEAWIAIIPEPSTAALLGLGLAMLAAHRRGARS